VLARIVYIYTKNRSGFFKVGHRIEALRFCDHIVWRKKCWEWS